MILGRHTYRPVLLLFARLLSTATAYATSAETVDATRVCKVVPMGDEHRAWSGVVEQMHAIAPLAPSITNAAVSVLPMVRTVARTTRSAETLVRGIAATHAIDSTTASSRYGMYNHKILFVSLSRLHYLNRLMRLRI